MIKKMGIEKVKIDNNKLNEITYLILKWNNIRLTARSDMNWQWKKYVTENNENEK